MRNEIKLEHGDGGKVIIEECPVAHYHGERVIIQLSSGVKYQVSEVDDDTLWVGPPCEPEYDGLRVRARKANLTGIMLNYLEDGLA